jgi:hypothetical protein
MRALIGKVFGPLFEAIVNRLDPSVGIDDHHAFVRKLSASWPVASKDTALLHETFISAKRELDGCGDKNAPNSVDRVTASWHALDQARNSAPDEISENDPRLALDREIATLSRGGIWTETPLSARNAAAVLRDGLENDNWRRENMTISAIQMLHGHPPREWFLFKRGTYFGSSRLLDFLIHVCALDPTNARNADVREGTDPLLVGTVEVLDRLIRHIEVRRGDALDFATNSITPSDDPLTERLRFAIALFEASEIFQDLRYLNTAMKLVDVALKELKRQRLNLQDSSSLYRHLTYVVALSAQESRLREVLTT